MQKSYSGVIKLALFKDMTDEEINQVLQEHDKNKYLDDPAQGVSLIRDMLRRQEKAAVLDEFDQIVNDDIFPILAELQLHNELEIYQALMKISNQIREQKKIHILEGKKVLGVGGKFSAGKSSFINAITNSKLPEGQRPTTSIATYIVNAPETKNVAISMSDDEMLLDDMALEALTHQFYETYQIGFSKLIQNLVVYTPDFVYPNIAILDTPGYSKSDDSKNESNSDAELARNQLRAVDYLIWLVDSTQGVVTDKDLDFLNSLNVAAPILVVFTKADTETPENLERKIAQARISLQTVNKTIFDIIAYDSRDKITVIGEGRLEEYLNIINGDSSVDEKNDVILERYKADLTNQLKNQVKEYIESISEYEKMMKNIGDIQHRTAFINDYQQKKILCNRVSECKKKLSKYFKKLIDYSRNI
jgi:GTPase Era involved in 16S rRNA processing